jgi:hypothetical protein
LRLRRAIRKRERQRGLVARREWDILKISMRVCNVFTRVTGSISTAHGCEPLSAHMVLFKQLTGNKSPFL